MPNVIHGTGKPRIVVGETTIDLPYCESMMEYFELDNRSKKLYADGGIENNKKGWYYRVVLNYGSLMKKSILESLEPLFDISNSNFLFYPRRDNENVFYTVDLPDDFVLKFSQRQNHRGHRGVVLTFVGMERLTSLDLTNDPSEIPA